jgi:uncharacterized membrane protein (TIGR02234 family)
VSGRRGLVVSLALIGLGAATLLMVASRTWWTVSVTTAGSPTTRVVVVGRHAASAATGLGLLGLAALAGVLATRGLWRRLVGAVVALAGLAAIWSVWVGGGDRGWRTYATRATSDGVHVVAARAAWPWVALAAAVLMTIGGLLVAVVGHRWPGWSGRYDGAAPPQPTPAATAAPHELWDALDRGEDPTASPDVAPSADLPE